MNTDPERILVPLADGFEELEAIAIIDILRRADLDVTVAGLQPGAAHGAHNVRIAVDVDLGELDLDEFTMLVLPGGMGGTRALMADERILGLIRRLKDSGRRTAAICAAPMVLNAAGVIDGVEVTSHPSVQDQLGAALVRSDARVVRAGPILTSQGPGTAVEFALALVAEVSSPARARELASAMCVSEAASANLR